MKMPPVLLALQESVNEAEADQSKKMAAETTTISQQPLNPEPEGLPPIILGKQGDQAVSANGSVDNSIEARILDSNTEAFVPVTEDSTGTDFDSEIVSTLPTTLAETTRQTAYNEVYSLSNLDNEMMRESSGNFSEVESQEFQSTEYAELETSTPPISIDFTKATMSDTEIVTSDFDDDSERLTTVTAVEFETVTDRTYLVLEDTDIYESNTVTDSGDGDHTSNTSTDMFTVTDTSGPSTTILLDIPKTEVPRNEWMVDDVVSKDILLEASPTAGVGEVTDVPVIDPSKLDFKIVTTRKGLQVDAHDTTFDPSQIAKATSYVGSSYSTATRSATVTTWVDPDDKNVLTQRQSNSTNSKTSDEITHLKNSEEANEDPIIPSHALSEIAGDNSALNDSDGTLIMQDQPEVRMVPEDGNKITADKYVYVSRHEMSDIDDKYINLKNENISNFREISNQNYSSVPKSEVPGADSPNNTSDSIPKEAHGYHNLTFRLEGLPMQDKSNYSNDDNIKNTTDLLYELPGPSVQNNTEVYFSTSVVIALSVCCSVVLLAGLVTFTLWLCRRHRSRSKIYLSREAVKPRAFFTKPMNPALLPDESIRDPQYVLEFQRPRAPVMLGNDQKNIIFKSEKSEDLGLGLENDGFTDIPLEDLKIEGYKKKKRHSQDPPKYSSKAKMESDTDSGIRVWSSTGSLYTASPQLTHCSVPPPPYSPSIGEEPVCLSVHSLPSLSKKLGLIDL
ncbi:uncharacterized protein LOC134780445 [Penaeus indicus]|uniref:uncharacterized protein LOC134780445 n=1 Tax=Penaeus indicus TaxID=29960 RepID=UPI00300C576E